MPNAPFFRLIFSTFCRPCHKWIRAREPSLVIRFHPLAARKPSSHLRDHLSEGVVPDDFLQLGVVGPSLPQLVWRLWFSAVTLTMIGERRLFNYQVSWIKILYYPPLKFDRLFSSFFSGAVHQYKSKLQQILQPVQPALQLRGLPSEYVP